ncbi:hypothetical protein T02_12838 [Trichinella nativa]|uniref:Uncharacterized protein n=3 Tax=Trichinella TaxID=6333 RepID=A0A0V1KQH9_9BILA|nr:hypothetical protein T09_6408 [Trichinella sp. T9]KRY19267.1 hypothetical protein T12_12400 [Trichinella patagoniensis]KRY47797.1 hypothetical protein T03_12499 [Trichinella britovi]KRZ49707.1 hypothetical protein T02_12838 [Trichinella nativa]KRZ96941.1 hypothetical protein T08_7447 [Trichinella sp. T8]
MKINNREKNFNHANMRLVMKYFMPSVIKLYVEERVNGCPCSVAVITSALHAEGPWFEPRQGQDFLTKVP